jgi:Tol biopolymer transport system component
MEGGAVQRLVDQVDRPRLSYAPDGKMIAVHLWGKKPNDPSVLAAIPAEGGEPVYHIDAPPGLFGKTWSPDGKAFQYSLTRNGVSNLWEQPLTGGPAKQLTHFKSEQISDFVWSHDAKRLALARGKLNSNVVLISNFQ